MKEVAHLARQSFSQKAHDRLPLDLFFQKDRQLKGTWIFYDSNLRDTWNTLS